MTKNTGKISNTNVFVAMSGGVDSSVSAVLLKQKGYKVTGVFMKNWSGDDYGLQTDCPWEKDQKDAQSVCDQNDIAFQSYNFEKEYREIVVKYFFEEIKRGRTPNPDVLCNKEIKFGLFLKKAMQDGADLIATGHYSQVLFNEASQEFELHKGLDNNKDQSYFLHYLTQKELFTTLFPLGKYQKSEVRELANKFQLPVAKKPDSQGICFIGEINVSEFLRKNIQIHSGKIIDIDTKEILGKHDGYEFYTLGQREGLKIGGSQKPYYVASKDKNKNIIYVAMGSNNPALARSELEFEDLHITNNIPIQEEYELEASIRYRQRPSKGVLNICKNSFTFASPQKAITPGQSIVLYDKSRVFGGAIIK